MKDIKVYNHLSSLTKQTRLNVRPSYGFQKLYGEVGKDYIMLAPPPRQKAVGGFEFTEGDYHYHVYTKLHESDFLVFDNIEDVEVLLIGGGGGGGCSNKSGDGAGPGGQVGGGGGAGGVQLFSNVELLSGSYEAVVGLGGVPEMNIRVGGGATRLTYLDVGFTELLAVGGGGGGIVNPGGGGDGGSGGGAGGWGLQTGADGGAGTEGQGFAGADTMSSLENSTRRRGGGGGGRGGIAPLVASTVRSGGLSASMSSFIDSSFLIDNFSFSGQIAGGGGGGTGYAAESSNLGGGAGAGNGHKGSSSGTLHGSGGSATDIESTEATAIGYGSGGGGAVNSAGTGFIAGKGASGLVVIRYLNF